VSDCCLVPWSIISAVLRAGRGQFLVTSHRISTRLARMQAQARVQGARVRSVPTSFFVGRAHGNPPPEKNAAPRTLYARMRTQHFDPLAFVFNSSFIHVEEL